MAKIDPPELGAYRYGTLTGAEFAPSKRFPDKPQVKLIGNWEGEGDGNFWYAYWKTVTVLARAGLLKQEPGDKKKFTPVMDVRFCIYRTRGEGDTHDWFVATYGEDGQTVVVFAPFADPVEPQAAAQAAAPPPPQQAGQSGPPGAPPPQLSGASSAPDTPPPNQEGPASGNPPPQPPANHSTAKQRAEDKAKRERKTLAKVDALYALALVVAAYQQVRFFNVPSMDLDVDSLQAGAATVMISLEKNGYDPATDRRPAYLKRLRRVEHQLFPDDSRCPDPDAKPADEEKPKRRSRAKPKKEEARSPEHKPTAADLGLENKGDTTPESPPSEEPAPVSTVPGSTFAGVPAGLEEEEDDLPF